jgi:hypothetical protein
MNVSDIVAIHRTCGRSCPLITFTLSSKAVSASRRVTLHLCEWQQVARRINQASAILSTPAATRRAR